MTVASEITRLYGVRSDIFTAIEAKGVTVPSGSQLDDCPSLIGQISGGVEPPATMPANTLRLLYPDGDVPTFIHGTATQVSSSPNLWDLYSDAANWSSLLSGHRRLLKVIAAGDTSSVTSTQSMFYNCTSLTSVQLFDTSSATSMNNMFYNCSALLGVPLFNTSTATNLSNMLYNCSALLSIPLFDTSSATNMSSFLQGCRSLTSVPLLDTSSATDMSYFLRYGESLTSVPRFDTSSVTNMNYFLAECPGLTSIPLFNTSAVTTMNYAFSSCYKVEQGALALYQQASGQTTPPTTHSATFRNCGRDTQSGSTELAQIPSDWK